MTWEQAHFGNRGTLATAVGAVTGVRWWSLQDDAGLVGAFGGRWGTGENVGRCGAAVESYLMWSASLVAGATIQPRAAIGGHAVHSGVRHHGWARALSEPGHPEHAAADPQCACGFYAFWQAEPLPVHEQYPVVGVIEGYGQTVLGTRGFRCQRARILGLHLPTWSGGSFFDYLMCDQYIRKQSIRVASRYQVPVYDSFQELLERHPPTTDYTSLPLAGEVPPCP